MHKAMCKRMRKMMFGYKIKAMHKGMRKMMFGYKTHQIAEHYLNKWDRYQDPNKNQIRSK